MFSTEMLSSAPRCHDDAAGHLLSEARENALRHSKNSPPEAWSRGAVLRTSHVAVFTIGDPATRSTPTHRPPTFTARYRIRLSSDGETFGRANTSSSLGGASHCTRRAQNRNVSWPQNRGVVGRGRRPPLFSTGGRVPYPQPLFGLKFVQKSVHCCNWLLTETQRKIISVLQN